MNNKIKAFLLAILTLTVTLTLSGCGGSDKETAPEPAPAATFVAGTHPRFDPVISDVPFNTDLIFAKAATTDGTADVGAATDAVRSALNMLDGFSTSAYFDIMIQGSVNPATVLPMQTVFLLQLNTGTKDALNPANIVGIVGPATFDTKVVSLDGGTNNVIRIRPTLPLKSKAKYLVILTNDIKDASGAALTRSWTYNALHDSSFAVLPALEPVRTAVKGWETLAAAFLTAVNPSLNATTAVEKLTLTYTFTTTDPQAPLIAMAAPRAAIASTIIPAEMAKGKTQGEAAVIAVTKVTALDAGGYLPTPKQRPLKVSALTGLDFTALTEGALAGGVGKLYTGYIKLPYYQTAPGTLPFAAYLTKNWTPDVTLATLLGVTVPADVNGSINVTYRYPFAAKTTDESIPLQVTLPIADWVPGGLSGSATCGQIYASSGYPLVIYVHGITTDRTSGIALAHTLASKCVATVAIDLPLHGVAANNRFAKALNVEKSIFIPFSTIYGADAPHERHFNVAGAGGAPAPMNFDAPTDKDGSGVHFTNLGYLANTRDNNREAVIDLLNLNASLKGLNDDFAKVESVGFNLSHIDVVGLSLGGILSTVFTSVNQVAIANDALVGLPSNLNPIHGLVASAAGTQVAQVLANSASFGPIINAGLAASGVNVGTSSYEKFMYAAQSTVDSGDPVNFAQLLATLGIPVFVQQVNGDLVVPNSAASAPLTGTQALVRLLGATQLGLGQTQLGRGYVQLNAGDHVSLIRPATAAPQVTAEMQAQVLTFVLGNANVAIGSQYPANIDTPPAP